MASPRLNKLDSHLQALVAARNVRRAAKRAAVPLDAGGRVLVDVYVRGRVPVAAKRLRAIGMRVGATSSRGGLRIVEGRLPVRAARRAAALGRVRAVVTVPPPVLSVGAATSQGDAAHRGPQARALGPAGAGVDVGIISDSINQVGGGVAASKASGDLPSNVTVLSDFADPDATDEGRAMAEIAFDIAPGMARILFGSALAGGPVEKAATIDSLVAAGADVIADDTSFLSEPFFQDSVVGRAVDRARAAGTVYFTAAGNQARQSWEGTFSPSATLGHGTPTPGPLHDFQVGAGEDTMQTLVNVPIGGTISVFLQWDEAYGQAVTDLDIYLTDPAGNVIGAPGISDNIDSRIPFDGATFTNSTNAAVSVRVEIERFAGPRAPFMKYIANGDIGTFTIGEHETNSDAIVPDAATSNGSITVAAVRANEPGLNDPEPFSSRGLKTILFDQAGNRLAVPEVRQKPELAAADGVATTVPGFGQFFGTSAAAPHAAGVAALLRSRDPTLTPDAIETVMTSASATTDCSGAEPDFDCGFGFVFADGALSLVPDPTPPVITPVPSPPAPQGQNGFYTSDVGLTWSVFDPGSVVSSTSGCGPATVAVDTTGTAFTCSATSGGGTASQSTTLKRDTSPPTAPVFRGIAARTFERAFVPPASVISCAATDATSGIDANGCVASGYSTAIGPHTLTGTVRDNAGLTSVRSLTYRVVATKPAISRLTAARVASLEGVLRRGLLARVVVARAGTRLTAVLTGPRRLRVARVTRSRAGAGRASLRLKPTRRGRAFLRSRRRTVLKLAVSAKPRVGKRRTLTRRVTVRG